MNVEEIKIKTMAMIPTIVHDIEVFPITLREIAEVGYEKYNMHLSILTVRREQLLSQEILLKYQDMAIIDLLKIHPEKDLFSFYIEGLKLFLKGSEINYLDRLYINDQPVESNIIEDIINVIKVQNCMITETDDDFNPVNEKAREIRQKILESRKKVSELKKSSSGNNDSLSFSDLISIVSANANGLNILNVFDLNMFQFNDQFNRMKMIDEYEVSIQALLHGADSKQINLKHWISKMG